MKRFSKLLALGLAAALMFGMTAQAAGSPTTTTTVTVDGTTVEGVSVSGISTEDKDAAETAVKGMVGDVSKLTGLNKEFVETQKFVSAFELAGLDKGVTATITFSVPEVQKDHRYLVYHFDNDGNLVEVQRVHATETGKLSVQLTGASPILVYEYTMGEPDAPRGNDGQAGAGTSPKTGEAAPVAGMMALVLLAGAALCAGKARYNR